MEPQETETLGGIVHTYQKYDPVHFPSPTAPPPDVVSAMFDHLLTYGNTDEFTEDSKQIIDGVFAAIAKRPVPDVLVVGHTDKVGSDQYNDALSRQRAGVVRAGLIDKGIASDNIVAVGRGKREPIVPTAEGIAEPLNRRVEIVVR